MVRFLLYIFEGVVTFLVVRLLGGALQQFFGTPRARIWTRMGAPARGSPEVQPGETARDPVCGMFVSTELSHRLTRGAQTLHFCSRECLERYEKEAAHAAS
jgi:YHS domain-containing protein